MSELALRVEQLGKQYSPGGGPQPGGLITDHVSAVARRTREAISRRLRPRTTAAAAGTGFWALHDVSFDVHHGEVVGVIGRNGAGKSTLLRILSRITRPTTGRAELYGRVGALLEVGTGFHPELTGRENIFMNGAILGMRRAEIARKFDEIVAFAEVDRFIDTAVKFYSTGMRVRLGFAVAAHLETEILLMDEVLAVGDAAFQQKCLGKMGDVARAGRTVIFVSHDLTAIQVLCQRALRLVRGRVAGAGAVASEIAAYLAETRGASARAALADPVSLGGALQLVQLDMSPAPVASSGPARLRLALSASAPARVHTLALTIQDALHRRVGLIDVRQAGAAPLVAPDRPLRVRVDLPTLPLVEGEYHVGLLIGADDIREERDELISFAVVAAAEQDYVPPQARTRGIVAFTYTVHAD